MADYSINPPPPQKKENGVKLGIFYIMNKSKAYVENAHTLISQPKFVAVGQKFS